MGMPSSSAHRARASATPSLLPARLGAPFHLPFGRREQALARSGLALVRAGYRYLPARLRWVPSYNEAQWRLAGRGPHVDTVGRWLEETTLSIMLRSPPSTR